MVIVRKKLILVLAMLVVFALSFAACGGSDGSGTGGTSAGSSDSSDTGGGGASSGSADIGGEIDKSDWVKLDLSFATYLPQTDAANMDNEFMISSLKEALGDEWVELTWYPSSSLLGQTETLEGIIAGTADIGFLDMTSYPEDFPATNLWGQPGLKVGSSPGGSAALTEWVFKNIDVLDEWDDVIFLSGQSNGPCTLLTTFPVASVNDLKGNSLRCAAILSATLQSWGANPINLPTGEAYEAMRTGMIEGQYASFGGMVSLGLGEFAKNATSISNNTQTYAMIMNKDVFNSMPESQQEAFLAGWDEFFWNKTLDHFEEKQILIVPSIIENAGVVTWNWADGTALEKEFTDASAPLLEDYMKKLDGKGFDSQALLDDVNGGIAKWVDGWWDKDREMEVYVACSEGRYEEWLADYSIPPNKPDHIKATLDMYK